MVYEWRDKEAECYRLYVDEQRSLDEVMEWMKEQRGFSPSKQNPAHKNAALVSRTKELWEQNATQKEMLRILRAEGFRIKERELMRLRARHKWLLRTPNGMRNAAQTSIIPAESTEEASLQQVEQALLEENELTTNAQMVDTMDTMVEVPIEKERTPDLDPQVEADRQERRERMQAESAERWATRKRRRRTRGWAGMPADPPGPPRFPSETTLDEAKAFLKLDNAQYRQARIQFRDICEQEGIVKKKIAGSEKWQAAKDRLIHENAHLHTVFFDDVTNLDQKYLSLDVLCIDVTKRMRTAEHKITLADAKNIIGINPDESRQIREAFYNILKADHFTSKLETGGEHWSNLKQRWIDSSDIVQRVLARGTEDPEHERKGKALEIICRDVTKRLRDDQNARGSSQKKQHDEGAIPQPDLSRTGQASSQPASTPTKPNSTRRNTTNRSSSDLQIDPSLLLAANDSSVTTESQDRRTLQSANPTYPNNPYAPHNGPFPIFFRLNPLSQTAHLGQPVKQVWLASLTSGSIQELRYLAVKNFPHSAIDRIEGLVGDANGTNIPYVLDRDDELGAYLAHTTGGKTVFSVTIAPGLALNTP
ncbi:MAG: hypothetical protein Q9165_005810 [Trypethelium subeluteriae]